MNDKSQKKNLVGPWHSVHAAIWLIGLYILFTRGWLWPGILVLIAISALYEAFLQRYVPGAYVEEVSSKETISTQPAAPAAGTPAGYTPVAAQIAEHRIELLPQVCPNCNAPIRGHEVKWTGAQSANCPYCGTNLPMNKA